MEEENNCPCVPTKKTMCEECLTMTPVEGGCLFESTSGESCLVGPSDGNDISTFTATFTEGVQVGTHGSANGDTDIFTPLTTLTNVGSVYTYLNENGDTVSFDLCECMPEVTQNGTIYTWTPGDGTSTIQWDTAEVITTLATNPDGSYTYTSEDGTVTNIAAPVVTTLVGNPDGSFTYTSEDGTITTIPAPTDLNDISTLTEVVNPDGSITYTHTAGGVSQAFTIPAPVAGNTSVVTSVVDPDGTTTYTHDDGTGNTTSWVTSIPSTLTEVVNANNTKDYTHENGAGVTQTFCTGAVVEDEDGRDHTLDCTPTILGRTLHVRSPQHTTGTVDVSHADSDQTDTGVVSVTHTRLVLAAGQSQSSGNRSVVLGGVRNTQSGNDGATTGRDNVTDGNWCFTAGTFNNNLGNRSLVCGTTNTYDGQNGGLTHGQGNLNSAIGSNVGGFNNVATNNADYCLVSGAENTADEARLIIGGFSSTSTGVSSITVGNNNNNSADISSVFGGSQTVEGIWNGVRGFSNTLITGAQAPQYTFLDGLRLNVTGGEENFVSGQDITMVDQTNNFTHARNFTLNGDSIKAFSNIVGAVQTINQGDQLVAFGLDVAVGNILAATESIHTSGNILANGVFYPSDEKLKDNLKTAKLPSLAGAEAKTFTWKPESDPDADTVHAGREVLGLSAQELQKIDPRLVREEYTRQQYEYEVEKEEVEVNVGFETIKMVMSRDKKGNVTYTEYKEGSEVDMDDVIEMPNLKKPITKKVMIAKKDGKVTRTKVGKQEKTGRLLVDMPAVVAMLVGKASESEKQKDELLKRVSELETKLTK